MYQKYKITKLKDVTYKYPNSKNQNLKKLNFKIKLGEKVAILGKTGSGKTDILKILNTLSLQMVDLEGIANHKGSAFGAINEQKQNPQQVFEHELYNQLSLLDSNLPVLLEDEAQTIGFNKLPHGLWQQMKQSTIIKIEIPFELRVQKLVED